MINLKVSEANIKEYFPFACAFPLLLEQFKKMTANSIYCLINCRNNSSIIDF